MLALGAVPSCSEGQGVRLGTALVPTDASYGSRSSTGVDATDELDAPGSIDTNCRSAGGRKVAGSNPAAPTLEEPYGDAPTQISAAAVRAKEERAARRRPLSWMHVGG
jgi:hypothetical protein